MHRHSALETIYKVGKYSSSEKQSLTFKELKSLEILQIACWPDKIDEMNNLISKELKIKNIPRANPKSPTLFTTNALIAALFADSFLNQNPIKKYEHKPTPSQPKNN